MVLVVVGLVLLVRGVRGRRVNDHPVCRNCRFDLVGVYPASQTCPECGADLVPTKAVRRGVRRKRRGSLAAGLVLFVAGAGLGGTLAWGWGTNFNWNTVKPVWLLLREARSGNAAVRTAALDEFERRLNDDALPRGALRRVLDAGLDHQGDLATPWNPEWGDVLITAIEKDLLTDAELERFLRHALNDTLEVRPEVRYGDPLPYQVRTTHRTAVSKPGPSILARDAAIRVNQESIALRLDGSGVMMSGGSMSTGIALRSGVAGMSGSFGSSATWHMWSPDGRRFGPNPPDPGEHTVDVFIAYLLEFGEGVSSTSVPRLDADGRNSSEPWTLVDEGFADGRLVYTERLKARFRVLPPGEDSVEPGDDPDWDAAEALRVTGGRVRLDSRRGPNAIVRFDQPPACDLAFECFALANGRRWYMGTLTWSADRPINHCQLAGAAWPKPDGTWRQMRPPVDHTAFELAPAEEFDADLIDIELLPSPSAARMTTTITRYLDRPFLIKGVKVGQGQAQFSPE